MDAIPLFLNILILGSFNPRARDGRDHYNQHTKKDY